MKAINIFISYSHDDGSIAMPLSNLLQSAFGPLTEIFLDRSSISFGSNIKESVNDALKRADVLIAVIAGAQPTSTLSWPGYEIGTFSAFWVDEFYQQGVHKDRKKSSIIGQVIILSNGNLSLGPQEGQRPVNLGISEDMLSQGETDDQLANARKAAAVGNNELLDFLKDIEEQVKNENKSEYIQFTQGRSKTLSDLVRDYKYEIFDVLKNRVRGRSKLPKQLIVRSRGASLSLTDDAKIISIGGASEVFGKSENDSRLFSKKDVDMLGNVRYEATWSKFKADVEDHNYGLYWCGVIEQAVVNATRRGPELDSNLVLISSQGQRYRIIATTVTTYFNNDFEVCLYLIQGLQRIQRGDMETSSLLNCLTIVCRFRFAFLEGTSPFYWRNFELSPASPRELLIELDYLKSEAVIANLDQPGAYEEFMKPEQLTEMVKVWNEVDLELRKLCNAAIAEQNSSPSPNGYNEQIVTQLKRIANDVRPFNTLLGAAVSKALLNMYEDE